MKKAIGIFIVLLSLSFITILFLRIWEIYIVSIDTIVKSSLTLVVLGLLIVILIIAYGAFFKKDTDHNKDVGNRANPKL